MRLFFVFAISLGFIVLVTSSLCRPGGPTDRSDDGPSIEGNNDSFLVHRPNPLLERSMAKNTLAKQVIRGEIGLFEAASRVRDLYGNDPFLVIAMRRTYPNTSDEELY